MAEPISLAVLESEKIVVRPPHGAVAHLSNAQWSDRLPKLLQARLVQAFENGSRLRTVSRPGERVFADFQLLTDVRAFQIAVGGDVPVAEVEISAKVVADRAGRIVAARIFRATVPAAAADGPGAVQALDEAFQRVAAELVQWASRVV